MKKLLIALIVLGLIAVGSSISSADSTRTTPHKFRAFTTDTAVTQGATIFRITGYVTETAGKFGIYNTSTLATASNTTVAVEGGEATDEDALAHMYFGEEGLTLDSGMTVVVYGCTVVIEYL